MLGAGAGISCCSVAKPQLSLIEREIENTRVTLPDHRDSSKLYCFAEPQILTAVHCFTVAQDFDSSRVEVVQKRQNHK
jgi:hypothetical protein